MITIPAALIIALISVESRGDNNAHGDAGEVGCLQITQGVITDVNRILKRGTTAFTLKDALDRPTSVFICQTYIQHYATPERLGREPTCIDLARCWNGGPDGYKKPETEGYWQKVKTELLVQGAFDLIP